ncbi:MAG TPA: cysteine hydrolase [Candidatus Dormibacteraeota bacterium]|nr:cysteine hydrolase [Candidatus Dormibacteraeota bacterium]
MPQTQHLHRLAVIAAIAGLIAAFSPAASAQGVLSEWKTVEAPPPPELKTVTVDPQKTALLVMDFNQGNCVPGAPHAVPRCIRAVPKVKQLLAAARAHHMLIVFTQFPHMPPFVKGLGPEKGNPMVVAWPNKFYGTDLGKILKDHGIDTVITAGMSANGAVLYTTLAAAQHGYKVVVPVDAAPGPTAYAEQFTVWGIANNPLIGRMSVLTSVDRIHF